MLIHSCERCEEDGIDREGEDYNDGMLGASGAEYLCRDHRDAQAERAYDRMVEDYYGGSGACTEGERNHAAHQSKREGR